MIGNAKINIMFKTPSINESNSSDLAGKNVALLNWLTKKIIRGVAF